MILLPIFSRTENYSPQRGKLEDDKVTGTAKTEMDGSEVTSTWSAKRK